MLIQTLNARILQRGLKQRVQNMKACFICGKPCAWYFHPTKAADIRFALGRTRPWATPMFKLNHFLRSMIDKILDHILLTQPVTTRDCVMKVVIKRVVIAHHTRRTAFGSDCVRTHGINFGNQCDGGFGGSSCDFDCGTQPRATCADDGNIGLDDVHKSPLCLVDTSVTVFIVRLSNHYKRHILKKTTSYREHKV